MYSLFFSNKSWKLLLAAVSDPSVYGGKVFAKRSLRAQPLPGSSLALPGFGGGVGGGNLEITIYQAGACL